VKMKDHATFDLNNFLTAEEKAQEVTTKKIAYEAEKILDEITDGKWDSDLAQHFDPEQLIRVVRCFATMPFDAAARMTMDDLRGISDYITKDYALDMAERRVLL